MAVYCSRQRVLGVWLAFSCGSRNMTMESLAEVVYCFHEFEEAAENLRRDLVQLQRQLNDLESRQNKGCRSAGIPYYPVGMGASGHHTVTLSMQRPTNDAKDITSHAQVARYSE